MSDSIATYSHQLRRPPPAELGINVQKPLYRQFALLAQRMDSFDSWPAYLPVSVKDLAEAGFVYTGVGDNVRCYYCGGGLQYWEPDDVPMYQHAKWYPGCPHVLLVKGKSYIEKVLAGEQMQVDGDDSSEDVPARQRSTLAYMDTPAAQSCTDMGFSAELVHRAISIYIKKHGKDSFKGQDLCEILLDMEESPKEFGSVDGAALSQATANDVADAGDYNDDSEDVDEEATGSVEELMAENERLKHENMCKICLDKRADVIFLPCGHIVSCPLCAPALTECPICRKSINGHLKAYFSK